MSIVYCPDCKAALSLDLNTKAGKRLTCPHCQTDLELINTSPFELDFAYDELGILWDRETHDEAAGQSEQAGGEKLELLE